VGETGGSRAEEKRGGGKGRKKGEERGERRGVRRAAQRERDENIVREYVL